MSKLVKSLVLVLAIVTGLNAADKQDIRILTSPNADLKISPATIEKAFEANGFSIDGNNNMNKPFKARFGSTHYKTYHLFTFHNPDAVAKLAPKYPEIGLLTPFSMSLWSDGDKFKISSLTLRGISRITQIPEENKDLVALYAQITKALKAAMPKGTFEKLAYTKVADMKQQLATKFEAVWETEEDQTLCEFKEDWEAEFEGEMEPIGFLFPGFIGVRDELEERGVHDFHLYDTYSVCKLDVIHPISKVHPEVGAFAPCTFYIYKKVGEKTVKMGFPSVDNWITATDIEDEVSLKPLVEAQKLFEDVVNELN